MYSLERILRRLKCTKSDLGCIAGISHPSRLSFTSFVHGTIHNYSTVHAQKTGKRQAYFACTRKLSWSENISGHSSANKFSMWTVANVFEGIATGDLCGQFLSPFVGQCFLCIARFTPFRIMIFFITVRPQYGLNFIF
jgi:hypothetical protein